MAPIKLEDHIREQFEEREIAPSAAAWDKLEAKLDKEQGKKRPVIIWYAIAASIVGMLLVASQFFFNVDSQADKQMVDIKVESPSIEIPSTSEILKTETQLAETPKVIVDKNKPVIVNKKNAPVIASETKVSKKTKKIVPAVQNTSVAVNEKEKASNQNISEAINKEIIFSNKVDEVVAAVQNIQKENNTVSAAEIDALLLNAQRDLATERILNESKIDATALLNDVEFELEKSFRDKVFDALGDGFSKIRTAVVDRNN